MINIANMTFEEWIEFMFQYPETFRIYLQDKGYTESRIKKIYDNANAHRMYPKQAEMWDNSPRCNCKGNRDSLSCLLDIGTRYVRGHKQVMTIDFCVVCNKEVGTRRDWCYVED